MDPVSRRFMWEVISNMCKNDSECSVILTTHGMDEAEALCNRIGIMVNGKLTCLGSPQHLKHRFGNGFEINIRTKIASSKDIMNILDILKININRFDSESKFRIFLSEKVSSDTILDNLRYEMSFVVLTVNDLLTLSSILDVPSRHERVTSNNINDILLGNIIQADSISCQLFIEWWLAEDSADKISQFMNREFSMKNSLLERSSLFTFRYRINFDADKDIHNSNNRTLSDIFRTLELHKNELNIEEYSLEQTSLEQIFNQFAATQNNPM